MKLPENWYFSPVEGDQCAFFKRDFPAGAEKGDLFQLILGKFGPRTLSYLEAFKSNFYIFTDFPEDLDPNVLVVWAGGR